VRTARNIAIIALLAVPIAFVPGGGNVADAIIVALTCAFLAGAAAMVYVLWRQNQMTFSTLSDSRRAMLYAAVGGIALLIAAQNELSEVTGGIVIWIALLVACGFAIFAIWREANTL
jgi:peptidoglycan/LPS O-acetylase OafA/YrhL